MEKIIDKLHLNLQELEEEYGGDVSFVPVVSSNKIDDFEKIIDWRLPSIFRYFYSIETNGLQLGNKVIYSLTDESQKKTLVNSLERNNDPKTSYWFKGRPHIFKDYLVIAADGGSCFCLSKKYEFDNPSIYICENMNSKEGISFEKLELDLNGLISIMVQNEFE